jgi:hypothetical protein
MSRKAGYGVSDRTTGDMEKHKCTSIWAWTESHVISRSGEQYMYRTISNTCVCVAVISRNIHDYGKAVLIGSTKDILFTNCISLLVYVSTELYI